MSNKTSSLVKQVTEQYKIAMAVVLRDIADHDWGWFSREDERAHLQTVDATARTGPKKAKVWLEDRGRRICVPALNISGDSLKKLQMKVQAERLNIEARWINFMIKNGWIKTHLDGSMVTVTAYPASHNKFVRVIDLRDEFPGAYSNQATRPWSVQPPEVSLDDEHATLAVGRETNLDQREHIDLTKWVFQD